MTFVFADRVRETTTTVGTGPFALLGPVNNFRSLSAVMAVGDTCDYFASGPGGWEVGVGTLTAATALARTTILSSSNGGSVVNFTTGLKDVTLGVSASKIIAPWTDRIRVGATGTPIPTPSSGLNLGGHTVGSVDSLESVDLSGNRSVLNPEAALLSVVRLPVGGASVAAVDMSLPAGFNGYQLEVDHWLPVTDGSGLRARVSTDGGATYLAGTAYSYALSFDGSDATTGSIGSAGVAFFTLVAAQTSVAGRAGAYASFRLMQPPSVDTGDISCRWESNSIALATVRRRYSGSGVVLVGGPVRATHLRLLASAGNIASMSYRLYGLNRVQTA